MAWLKPSTRIPPLDDSDRRHEIRESLLLDLSRPRLSTSTSFSQPWLLSNIIDVKTGTVPQGLHEFYVTERSGVRVGVIGLVEKSVDFVAQSGSSH